MSDIQNSAISYTNKDFQEVYLEIMEGVKNLSPKWDPTVSNETDPGVVLLKELALAIDKVMYSGDKNALENFPLGVTQEKTSQQIFKLLGYYPHWYRTAEISVQLSSTDTDIERTNLETSDKIVFPMFTQICNDDQSLIFVIPSQPELKLEKNYVVCTALQGTIKTLSVGGSEKITQSMLDSNNRIYLSDYYVAENGIFISNYDNESNPTYNFWKKVDNLYTSKLTSDEDNIFEFGLDITTNQLYIQFPDNISSLIGSGLCIQYVITSGSDGNPSLGEISSFYKVGDGLIYQNGNTILELAETYSITSDKVSIQNTGIISSGEDRETIDQQYDGYKHKVGTFDTLVTCRDYSNALYNVQTDEVKVSNGFVCDRTNDIQSAYDIITEYDGIKTQKHMYDPTVNTKLTPFQLKIYAMQYPDSFDTKNNYNASFEVFEDMGFDNPNSSLQHIANALNNNKCLSHEFSGILSDKTVLFKNSYIIDAVVIPTAQLTETQKQSVKNNICKALYKNLNAHQMDFGEAPDFEYITAIIEGSDTKIKNAAVANFNYETWAVYHDSGDSEVESGWKTVIISKEHTTYLEGYLSGGQFYKSLPAVEETKYPNSEISKYSFFYDLSNGYIYTRDYDNNTFITYSKKVYEIQNDVIAKCILAGVTPGFITGSKNFNYQFNHKPYGTNNEPTNATGISSNLTIEADLDANSSEKSFNIKENEVVQLLKTKTNTVTSLGMGLRYFLSSQNASLEISKDQVYQLEKSDKIGGNNEFLYIYSLPEEDAEYFVCYKYYPGTIICPTFNLTVGEGTCVEGGGANPADLDNNRTVYNVSDTSSVTTIKNYPMLTATKTVDILKLAQYEISRAKFNYWYLITNTLDDDEKNFVAEFNKNGNYYYLTLENNEYFITTSAEKNSMIIYGAGTSIKFTTNNLAEQGETIQWKCPIVTTQKINANGVGALSQVWQDIPTYVSGSVIVSEQEYINLTEDDTLSIALPPSSKLSKGTLRVTSGGIEVISANKINATDYTISETEYKISEEVVTKTNLANELTAEQKKSIAEDFVAKIVKTFPTEAATKNFDITAEPKNIKNMTQVLFTHSTASKAYSDVDFTNSSIHLTYINDAASQFILVKPQNNTCVITPSINETYTKIAMQASNFEQGKEPQTTDNKIRDIVLIDCYQQKGSDETTKQHLTNYLIIPRTLANWESTSTTGVYRYKGTDIITASEGYSLLTDGLSYQAIETIDNKDVESEKPNILYSKSATTTQGFIGKYKNVNYLDNKATLQLETDESVIDLSTTYTLIYNDYYVDKWFYKDDDNETHTMSNIDIVNEFSDKMTVTQSKENVDETALKLFKYKQTITVTYKMDSLQSPTLSVFNISYIKDGTPYTLSKTNIGDGWAMKTYLNITCNNTTPMILTDQRQEVTVYYNSNQSQTWSGPSESSDETNVYIYCNQDLILSGQKAIHEFVTQNQITGDTINYAFYCYQYNPYKPTTVIPTDKRNIEAENATRQTSTYIYVNIPQESITSETKQGYIQISNSTLLKETSDNYIIRVVNTVGDGTNSYFKNDSDCMFISTANDNFDNAKQNRLPSVFNKDIIGTDSGLLKQGNYRQSIYLNVKGGIENTYYLWYNFIDENSVKDDMLVVIDPIKIRTKSDILTDSCLERLNELTQNVTFDLLFDVSENEMIVNPIVSETFLNSIHPFNKYTICQINKTNMQIR